MQPHCSFVERGLPYAIANTKRRKLRIVSSRECDLHLHACIRAVLQR
jgi:hypothetical protein